ncbi:hypothetical protein [Blastomonas sp.]
MLEIKTAAGLWWVEKDGKRVSARVKTEAAAIAEWMLLAGFTP